MTSREMLFDLNFKRINNNNEVSTNDLVLIKSELHALCYEFNLQIKKLERSLTVYSQSENQSQISFMKLLLQTKRISELQKKIYSTLSNNIAIGLLFSRNRNSELDKFFESFYLEEEIEKFNSLKKQLTFFSYK